MSRRGKNHFYLGMRGERGRREEDRQPNSSQFEKGDIRGDGYTRERKTSLRLKHKMRIEGKEESTSVAFEKTRKRISN